MRRIGVMAVHYGKEYIAWAVRGLALAVDEVHVFYTPSPSFGQVDWSAKNCDTEEELVAEANRFAKVVWHRISAHCEGDHRDQMLALARSRDAQLVAIADADEIWDHIGLQSALDAVSRANSHGRWLATFHNFWRSWKWTVRDHFAPIRIVDLRHPLTSDARLGAEQLSPIYHFGYAQTLPTMRYKLSCHGHKAEFKPGWLEEKFIGWDPVTNNSDLHPCVNDFWRAEATPQHVLDHLEILMPEHPFKTLDRID